MITLPATRDGLSRILHVAAQSNDADLAKYARQGLRMLNKPPRLPKMPRPNSKPVKAIRKGRAK